MKIAGAQSGQIQRLSQLGIHMDIFHRNRIVVNAASEDRFMPNLDEATKTIARKKNEKQ